MAVLKLSKNNQANESLSKYKLLSAYGGPGSIVHTQYGSIIISCIEEWGFLKHVLKLRKQAIEIQEKNVKEYVIKHAKLAINGEIGISNDTRLLSALINRKKLNNLEFLVLLPDIELKDFDNTVKGGNENVQLTVPSTFVPKIFFNKNTKTYKSYNEWYNDWRKNNPEDNYCEKFFPPKQSWNNLLIQDNIVLICENGHISDFPWSQFLRWRCDNPNGININQRVDLFTYSHCCGPDGGSFTSRIKIASSSANASGFDGKWLKCENCGRQTSLKGIMGVKIKCPGSKPWEVDTGENRYYSGNPELREKTPPNEDCCSEKPMGVVLTTGNNIYFSRKLASIYMPEELFLDQITLEIIKLEKEKEKAIVEENFDEAKKLVAKIKNLRSEKEKTTHEFNSDAEKEAFFRFQEYTAFVNKSMDEININEVFLKVRDVTKNLKFGDIDLTMFFSRILCIDNLKITTTQLDFSRVTPADADSKSIHPKNIFRSKSEEVIVYPVVENYGEGIFFALNEETIETFKNTGIDIIQEYQDRFRSLDHQRGRFSQGSIQFGISNGWQLYLVHTLSHLIMRELEFKCGYPTASLSEIIYVSNDERRKMYGFMIYTAEGAEGSMGGLIAQTNGKNLTDLIKRSLKRATICHSDPLCWESTGQGLFELNFASCFSCGLVSETSCELRNIYLDRRILVDPISGFFRNIFEND